MLPLAATLVGFLTLSQVIPSLEVTTEAGGGEAPVTPGQSSELGVSAALLPVGGVRVGKGDFGGTARYAPRLMWRRPNQTNTNRPLLLHNVDLGVGARTSPTTTLAGGVDVSYGEPDYIALQTLLANAQALPQVRKIFAATSSLDFGWTMSRRASLSAEARAFHRRPLGLADLPPPDPNNPAVGPALNLDEQTGFSLGPTYAYKISPLDSLSTVAVVAYDTRPETSYFIGSAGFGYGRQLGALHSLKLVGGLSYLRTSGQVGLVTAPMAMATPAADETETSWAPMAMLTYSRRIMNTGGTELSASGGLGVISVVDPILRTAGPRLQGTFDLDVGITPRLKLGWQNSFNAAVTHHPEQFQPGVLVDETSAASSLGLRYQMNPWLVASASVRWSDRGPNLRSDDFEFRQRELWGLVGLTFVVQRRAP